MPLRTLVPLILLLLLTACGTSSALVATPIPTSEPVLTPEVPQAGAEISPPRELTDFTLPSSRGGTPLSLSDLRGKPLLIYFGYTFCPDVCPTTLVEFIGVKQDLAAQADAFNVLMVSVDPERDTPEVLERYLKVYDPSFIGMSGDVEILKQIGPEYGLFYQRHAVEGSASAYLVDHSASAYLLDRQGRLRFIYRYGTPHNVMSADLQRLIAEQE
ncbi:electron transport protein SCO1/SenC [Oscillochloris trichoides DG-6]|uniref:Electron transport protein SCO1/SenC n=1 Tax=Oscillochloris trichoides DG-6 TaxID=765420 RepID=E1IDM9_9CHLR|nr:SCO family protein [Oscillochloris trichoides]EFO80737.1 electron transport protein SCO1/SenC [Oscillochloris trichoides DG-6]